MKLTSVSSNPGIKISPELSRLLEKSQAAGSEKAGFGDLLTQKIDQVDQLQKAADQSMMDVASGKSRNLHEAVLAMEMADTSLRMVVTVRNKVLEAYQEIMRMPI